MFQHHGPARTDRQNRMLAGYLATVAGFVNSAGFVMIGSLTSHVTGSVARFSVDIALGRYHSAIGALGLILSFFLGAFSTSMILETSVFRRTPFAYGFAMSCESALLVIFARVADFASTAHPQFQDGAALLLCAAMGMQNSLVTRLSGAVVRTTHLTGVVTDLGIEASRWFRWYRARMTLRLHVPLVAGRQAPALRPSPVRVALLATICGGFTSGAIVGVLLVVRLRALAMLVPAMGILAAATYAFWSGRSNPGGVSVASPNPHPHGDRSRE